MTFAPRAGLGPLVRSFTTVIAVLVLLAMLAVPAAADAPVKLTNPSVTPPSGTTATTFTFKVTYRGRDGSPPDYVRVMIGNRAYAMVPTGADWKRGAEFTFRGKLPAGDYKVLFVTRNGKSANEIAGQKIHVGRAQGSGGSSVSSSGTKPKPTPVPAVAARPTAAPDPTPHGAGPDGGDAGDPGSEPTTTGVGEAGQGGGGSDPGSGDPGPGTPGAGNPGSGNPDDRGPREVNAGLPSSWGDLTRYLSALGLDPAASPYFGLVPVMIWTTGGVALAMAFGFFGKRRRDGEPPDPDEVLSAHAARGTGQAATAALVPDAAAPQSPTDLEMSMPRWRRPSLLQARKADPLRDGSHPARLSFDHATVAPMAGYERRLIRYMVVQLLDTPDEFRGTEIGSLAQGDEVQLLERAGTYWRVFCPDGSEGWIHRMTLGDVVGEPPAPSARDAWATSSIEADEVDEDVLVAFMTARGRA